MAAGFPQTSSGVGGGGGFFSGSDMSHLGGHARGVSLLPTQAPQEPADLKPESYNSLFPWQQGNKCTWEVQAKGTLALPG